MVLRTFCRTAKLEPMSSSTSVPFRVGLLAYGAIGHEHNLAVAATPGLELRAVADLNPDRVAAALELAPDAAAYSDSMEMLDSGLIDIVVISTRIGLADVISGGFEVLAENRSAHVKVLVTP